MNNFILKILSGMVLALGFFSGSNLRASELNNVVVSDIIPPNIIDFLINFFGVSVMFVMALLLWELSFELDEEDEDK